MATSQPVYTAALVDDVVAWQEPCEIPVGLERRLAAGAPEIIKADIEIAKIMGIAGRHVDVINQGGLDLQYTKDAWLFKFEGIVRQGQGKTFGAFVAGTEYTLFQVFGGNADIGLLVEYLHDGRTATAPVTAFEDDIFAGLRLALNDTHDTSVLIGAIFDPSSSETFYSIEAERRLGQNYVIEFRARFFTGAGPGETLFSFSRDDYVQVRLARYF